MRRKFIAYYRCSTARQGRSGLGLDAQQEAVQRYVTCSDGELLSEFTEVESGKKIDRAQLDAALASCRIHGAVLVIAKLDRLARNLEFIARLLNTGVEFVATDNPTANRITIQILGAVAEHEREMISQRTKAALAQAKVRGIKLGGNRGKLHMIAGQGGVACGRARRAAAAQRAADLHPIITQIEAAGTRSLAGIAAALNAMNVSAPRGGLWGAGQIARVKRTWA
jgi:DNA invertase Pin-like site-specific DNA recombinase